MRIRPSIRLKADRRAHRSQITAHGLPCARVPGIVLRCVGCVVASRLARAAALFCAVEACCTTGAGAQPVAMKSAFVKQQRRGDKEQHIEKQRKDDRAGGGKRSALLHLVFRASLRGNRKESGNGASQSGKITLAFDHRGPQGRHPNSFSAGFRFTKGHVSGVIQGLDAQPHRLHEHGAATQDRQL